MKLNFKTTTTASDVFIEKAIYKTITKAYNYMSQFDANELLKMWSMSTNQPFTNQLCQSQRRSEVISQISIDRIVQAHIESKQIQLSGNIADESTKFNHIVYAFERCDESNNKENNSISKF